MKSVRRKHSASAAGIGFVLLAFSIACAAQVKPAAPESRLGGSHAAVLERYCSACHNDTLRTAGLSLQQALLEDFDLGAMVWEKVLRKLKSRSMPPAGLPRPDETTYETLSQYLESRLDRQAVEDPHPGPPSLRRLNRTEYANAVRDLFGIDIDADALLPVDDTMLGFDNVGKALTLSPLLVEKYLLAARKVWLQVLGDAGMEPVVAGYQVPPLLLQDEWMGETLPFGSRGGAGITHHFPLEGEYIVQVRLQRNSRDYIRGITEPHPVEIRLDGALVEAFTIGGEKHGRSAGIFSSGSQGDAVQEQYERTADEILNVRLELTAGDHRIAATFPGGRAVPEEPLYPGHSITDFSKFKGGLPGIRTIEIIGPYNAIGPVGTESRARALDCGTEGVADETCARRILHSLARRAYRRPPSAAEAAELFDFFREGRGRGGFDAGIGLAIERMLAGPEFLFVPDRVPADATPGAVFRLKDLDLATRLSLFLWSSIPDDELLSLAEKGGLADGEVLKQQVRRMLEDTRAGALVNNFAAQWLSLPQLEGKNPDPQLFPFFDENLRQAFQREASLYFEYILKQDRPLLELLDADYTFANERLAAHYGIPDVYGSHFRRVTLPDQTRGGILGLGSIMTVTSYANRTSPVIRGKWVLENILGAPPPAPPADVPGLVATNEAGKVLSMREQMEQHRANPVCASCHKVMDPLGFALEKYDAVGRWRSIDAASGSPVDSTGALPDGTTFEGPAGLRAVLVEKRREDFILNAVERLLTYALGRELLYTDAPAMREIMRRAAPDNYTLSSLITGVVESIPFQMRRIAGP